MPFGQSFFISRVVGKAVEMVTGDAELAKGARQITRLFIAVKTLDVTGQFLEHLAEAGIDRGVEVALEESAGQIVERATEQAGSMTVMSAPVPLGQIAAPVIHFGGQLASVAEIVARLASDPVAAAHALLEAKEQLGLSAAEIGQLHEVVAGHVAHPEVLLEQLSDQHGPMAMAHQLEPRFSGKLAS